MAIPVPGRVAEDLRRATVQVLSGSGREQGNGSGIVLPNARVLTNAHVIRGSRVSVQAWDGQSVPAVLVQHDRRRDLALLSVPGLRAPAATLGDSARLRPGMPVFAVGNPLGFFGALSSGAIYSVGREWVQADIHLAPGNSGGPLATFDGQVIGVNTMVIWGGLSLAIPSREAQAFLSRCLSRAA